MIRLALKTFTFGVGSKSMSTDNAVMGILPQRLLLTTLQNADFTRSADTKLYLFKNFNLNHFVMYVNGRQAPSGRVLRASDQRARAFPAHSLDRTNKCK